MSNTQKKLIYKNEKKKSIKKILPKILTKHSYGEFTFMLFISTENTIE